MFLSGSVQLRSNSHSIRGSLKFLHSFYSFTVHQFFLVSFRFIGVLSLQVSSCSSTQVFYFSTVLCVAVSSSSTFVMSRLNFFKLCQILADHDRCIEWCKEHNLLASSVKCPRADCSKPLSWTRRTSSRDGYEWRCSKKSCNGMASLRQNSWFSGSKLSIAKILALTYACIGRTNLLLLKQHIMRPH